MTTAFTGAAFVLAVHDLGRSARHYQDVLGFKDLGVVAPGWRFLARDAIRVHLGECPAAIDPASLGDHGFFAYIYVDSIDTYYAEIEAQGADVISAPQDKPWGLREMPVRTIDGHRVMFAQRL